MLDLYHTVQQCIEEYRLHGFIPTLLEIIPSGDLRYTVSMQWHDFIRDKDNRALQCFALLLRLLFPKKKEYGYSLCMNPRSRWSWKMNQPFLGALTAEQCIILLEKIPHSDAAADLLYLVQSIISDLVKEIQWDHETGAPLVRCVPVNPHISNKRVNDIMSRWGRFCDTDDTSMVLSVLGKYIQFIKEQKQKANTALYAVIDEIVKKNTFLTLLQTMLDRVQNHSYPLLKQSIPSGLYAYKTYTAPGANDIDPGTNVNIITCLLINRKQWRIADNTAVLLQFRHVLNYIHYLAQSGYLFDRRYHCFYTLPSFTFLWKRLCHYWSDIAECEEDSLDPMHMIEKIDRYIDTFWAHEFYRLNDKPFKIHMHDLLLLYYAFPQKCEMLDHISALYQANRTSLTAEFYYIYYPVKIIFTCPMFIRLVYNVCKFNTLLNQARPLYQ